MYIEFLPRYERSQRYHRLSRIPDPCVPFGVAFGAHLASHSEFPFEKYSTVVDVGGGIGAFSLPLAKTHKHIKITIQDLPEALAMAQGVSTLFHNHPGK